MIIYLQSWAILFTAGKCFLDLYWTKMQFLNSWQVNKRIETNAYWYLCMWNIHRMQLFNIVEFKLALKVKIWITIHKEFIFIYQAICCGIWSDYCFRECSKCSYFISKKIIWRFPVCILFHVEIVLWELSLIFFLYTIEFKKILTHLQIIAKLFNWYLGD